MEKNEPEDLLIRSFDARLSDREREILASALQNDAGTRRSANQLTHLRELLFRNEADSFGPFFAERIVNVIRNLKKGIDYQILFFFRKYQLAAIGVVIALIVLNILSSDQLTFSSIMGMEDQNTELVQDTDVFAEFTN